MEKEVLAILGKYGLQKKIYGKLDGTMPMPYEFSPDILKAGISKALGVTLPEKAAATSDLALPARPPVWCAGCPHRATFYAAKKAVEHLGIKNAVFPADIGCYSLSAAAPYRMGDYCLSMGSSVGLANGIDAATDQKVIAFIGDSTFFHSGMPAVVNAVHGDHKIVIVVLDNRITAMTGGQPNPGMPMNGMGEVAPEISIEQIVKAMGVGFVKTVDPANLAATQAVMEEALQFDGVAAVISKHPCVMIKSEGKLEKSTRQKLIFTVDKEKCDECMVCVTQFPALPCSLTRMERSLSMQNSAMDVRSASRSVLKKHFVSGGSHEKLLRVYCRSWWPGCCEDFCYHRLGVCQEGGRHRHE